MIDIPERIQAIRAADPDFWRNPDALKAALMVWQPECHVNASGVFSPCPREVVAKSGRAVAEVGVCRVREGVYVFCTSIQTSNFGYSYCLSVWVDTQRVCETEDEARRAGIAELIERTERTGGLSHGERVEMDGLRGKLREQVRQPTMF